MELTKQIKKELKEWLPWKFDFDADNIIEEWWSENQDLVEPKKEEVRDCSDIFSKSQYENIDKLIEKLKNLKQEGYVEVLLDGDADVYSVKYLNEDPTNPESNYHYRIGTKFHEYAVNKKEEYEASRCRKERIKQLEKELEKLRKEEKTK